MRLINGLRLEFTSYAETYRRLTNLIALTQKSECEI